MSDRDHEVRVFDFLAGLALGAFIGAGVALVTAPDKGRKTRRKLVRAASGARDSAQDQFGDLADGVRDRVGGAIKVARARVGR